MSGELLGTVIDGRYRIDLPIARGGMSTVYRGIDLRLDRPVAIKVMDAQFAADPAFRSRFEFEARSVARLNHPALVAVYDQGYDGEHAFLVMELVEGGTLRELLRERGPMPPHAVVATAGPVLDALAVAHRAGLVHRDVKPENILISDAGEVKIADFGLVRAAAAARTTSSAVILGTAAYLSPEQVTTGDADARSDVYSMGVLIFELLTGTPPFDADTTLSMAYQRIHQDVPAPSEVIAGVPPQFDALVAEATSREPAHRFPDAAAMSRALRDIAASLDLPAYRVPAPKQSAERNAQAATLATLARPDAAPAAPAPSFAATEVLGSTGAPDATATEVLQAPAGAALPVSAGVQQTAALHASEILPSDEFDPRLPPGDPPKGSYPAPDPHRERRKGRRTAAVWLVVVVILAAALGAGGWWLGSGRYESLPSVQGMDRVAALAAVTGAGFSPALKSVYSDDAPADQIIGTDPAEGSRAVRGDTVDVLVSLGKPSVPGFASGADETTVRKLLAERTLAPVAGEPAFSTSAPAGSVAALDPAPGTTVATGSQVRIIMSKGPAPVTMPDLDGLDEEHARAALEAVGLVVGSVRTDFDSRAKAGGVLTSEPTAGAQTHAGQAVDLVINSAVEVPSLMAHSVGDARSRLADAGLKVEIRAFSGSDDSIVITQSPSAGKAVRPGSTVTLTALP